MKIFFDTEFTGLHKDTTLISIGMVDEYGRTFYAGFSDYDETQCNDWIKENVIAHLNPPHEEDLNKDGNFIYRCTDNKYWVAYGNKEFVKKYLCEWFEQYDKVQLVSDVCHYDMVLFIDIFGTAFDIPLNVCPSCHDINQDIAEHYCCSESEAFNKPREEILTNYGFAIEGDKHNALYDAQVIKRIYMITH